MLIIDGSFGEGGGQILRTSLALSLITRRPFRLEKIRARRKNPGLLRQHLTSVNAAASIGKADLNGATLGSQYLTFTPQTLAGGDYAFAVGTAGSAMLVLQTVLPALLVADRPSTLQLEGGTHNPFAPPFDFLTKAYLPILGRMGARVSARLERYGFYPAGGGRAQVELQPCERLAELDLNERGDILDQRARAIVANLPGHIGDRELQVVRRRMAFEPAQLHLEETSISNGQGNLVMIEIESQKHTEVFTAFGEKGVRAEDVAAQAVKEARAYLQSEAAVGEHLADQLLVPLAIGSGGSFTTVEPSLHTTTNIEVIKMFLDVEITVEQLTRKVWKVGVVT